MFQYRSHSPQLKRNLISSIAKLLYRLLNELSNDLRSIMPTASIIVAGRAFIPTQEKKKIKPTVSSPLGGPECPHKKKRDINDLRSSKYQKNLRLGWRDSLVHGLSSRNETLAIAVKQYTKQYQHFLVLSNFTGFLHFIRNILSGIVSANTFLVITRPSLLQTSIFKIFYNFKAFLQSLIKL